MGFRTFRKINEARKRFKEARKSANNLVDRMVEEVKGSVDELSRKKVIIRKEGRAVAEVPVAIGLPAVVLSCALAPIATAIGMGVAFSQSFEVGLGEKSEIENEPKPEKTKTRPHRVRVHRRR